ncbi:T9SS type A sorting domain-containing protein [Candidatus Poribacteria bacterium]|nr:T9SS type A sorting domain-containing protein [Candidatus Poribacteria bacterium]
MVRTLAVSGTTLYAGTAGGGVFRLSVTAPPSISATSITPTAAVRGWTFPVTIAGSGLSGVTHIRLHRTTPTVADLSFPVTSATASSVVATFNLEGLAPDWVGVHAIHYSTDGSTYSPTGLTFSINFSSPGFHTGVPISGVRGETVTVTITGSGLIDITHLRLHNATASLDLTFPAVAAPDSASVTAAFDLSGLGPEWDGTHQIQYSIGGTSFEDAPGWMFTVNSPPAPIHQNWTATLRLTGDEAGDHTVIVGVAPDASDGVNLSAEDTLAPPMPQPPASWLRLLRGGQALSQDVLAFADARTWTIEVEVGSGTHYLSVEGLPEGVLAYYNDNPRIVHGPDTDATTAAVHPLPLGASISLNTGRHLLTLVLSKRLPQTLATTLGIRWRMFSLPGPTTNGAPADLVTRGVISMYGYNPSPEVQNYYSMFGDADDQVSGVQVSDDPLPFVSQGWFIFRDPAASPLATTFQVDVGDPAAQSVSVTLQPRWNLVGVPFGGASASAYNPTAKTVFGYDGVNYVIATSLAQFQGYWVYNELATARTVTITQPSPGAPAIVQRAAPSPDWVAPLTISLDSGALKTVELGSGSKAQMGFDAYDVGLPPAPPIRSYSEFFAATDDPVERMTRSVLPSSQREASWELSANLAEAGTLRWTAQTLPAGYRIIVESGDERHDLSREGSMRLDAGKHTFTARLTFAPPSRSRLMANYPNPFNPETWIPFELKEGSAVTVNIYDVAGSLVRKLDLGYREPGYYTSRADAAYWDGRNELGERVASGVYFYELRAGSFRETRRMVIHK